MQFPFHSELTPTLRVSSFTRLDDPLLRLHTSLTHHEYKTYTTKALTIKRDESPKIDRLKHSPVKEEPFSDHGASVSCYDYLDVRNPGWFGKGIRKTKRRRR